MNAPGLSRLRNSLFAHGARKYNMNTEKSPVAGATRQTQQVWCIIMPDQNGHPQFLRRPEGGVLYFVSLAKARDFAHETIGYGRYRTFEWPMPLVQPPQKPDKWH